MLSLSLNGRPRFERVLCLGAHCDDIEIGCGGTILALLKHNPNLAVRWVVFSSSPIREKEAAASAAAFLESAGDAEVSIKQFRNGFFPYVGADIKNYFETLKAEPAPDLILTHYRNDLHQDHRTIAELTGNTFRDHLVLEYEIAKYDGDLGQPNAFMPLEDDARSRKVELLMKHFPSQHDKQWFSAETFDSLMRLRGIECNAASGYAEAFYGRKISLAP